MCPACIVTIGGGLLLMKDLNINTILISVVSTMSLSFLIDFFLRKFNQGKVLFPYQRVFLTVTILLVIILLINLYEIK